MTRFRPLILAAAAGLCLFSPWDARAQGPAIDIVPAASLAEGGLALEDVTETHPPLKLSPDKSEILTLSEDAGSIVLGNPAHLNVLVDSARRLIAVPKAPGASYFTVLNKAGDVIMQRHVLVAPPKEKYVRVRKTCYGEAAKGGCQAMRTYYCPDICHEVASAPQEEAKGAAEDQASGMQDSSEKMAGEEGGDAQNETHDTQE